MHPRHVSQKIARATRAAVLLGICLGATALHAGIKSERLLAAIIRQTPEPQLVAAGEQMKIAQQAAATIRGAAAFWGVGDSMEPLFSDKTAIVVAPIHFKQLKKGMTVVYRSSRGNMVAHSLKGDIPGGWIAQGVGNAKEDDDLVTPENLMGVIVQAYAEAPSEYRMMLTKKLIAKGRLPAGQS